MRFLQNCILTILVMLGLFAIFRPNDPSSISQQSENILSYQAPEVKGIDEAFEDIRSVQVPQPPYFVRIRFVVERDKNGKLARTSEQIGRDLEIAKELYAPMLLDFVVIEAIEIAYDETISIRDYRYNATLHSNSISIYYIFGNRSLTPEGLSAFPWGEDSHGILINGKYANSSTLAHEIGHYFGLYHTFEEGNRKDDYVMDTYSEEQWESMHNGDKPYSHYKNLMNYSQSDETRLTRGQLERIRFYLIAFRQDIIFVDPLFLDLFQPDYIDISNETIFQLFTPESE